MRSDRGRIGIAAGLAMASVLGACASAPEVERDTARKAPTAWPTQAAPVWAMARGDVGAVYGSDHGAGMTERASEVMWGRVASRSQVNMVPGTLVRMTGDNVRDGDELLLGVDPTTRANDPAAVGAIVAEGFSAFDRSLDDRGRMGAGRDGDAIVGAFLHEVATAGVARMWVVEDGGNGRASRDLSPGDLLISADAPGCAMVDDASRYEVGYVVGRVAEHVEWARADARDTGGDGRRRMLAVVLVERSVRPAISALSRADVTELQQRELDRWRQEWERDASRRYRWEDMSRTWDEMDRFKKNWGDDWDDEKTWRDLRDSTKRMREQDEQLKRMREDLDKSRRELEDTRKGLDDLSRDVKGGRSDSGSRGGPDSGVKPSPR